MKVKKRIWILIMLVCVLLCACSIEDEYVETESVEEHFQPDYVKGEENKFMLSSRVVQQGSWIYFYNDREIMKMDENKNIYTVLNIEKVRGISVVGEWIYYATYEKMGKVRSDGELHEVLLQTASVGNFLVDGNMLYYFERYNVSATESNYAFHCYDMASKTDKFPDNGLGSKQYGGTVIGLYKDKLYLTYGEADKSQIYYIYTDTYDTKSDDLEATMLSIEGLENGIIYNDKLLYFKRVSIGFFSAKEQTEIYVVDLDTGMLEFSKQFINGENEGNRYGLVTKLAGACNIDGVEYWVVCVDYSILGLVPVEQAKKELPVKLPMKKIVEEAKGLFTISNAYVVGDYVYYIDNSGENDSMCRIKFDGTDWSQLY